MKTLNVDYEGLSINFKDSNHHDADILWEPTGDVEIDGKQYKAGDQIHVMSVEYDAPDNNYSLLNKFFSTTHLEMSSGDFEALKQAILWVKRKTWGEALSLAKKRLDLGYRISAVFVTRRRIGLL